MVMLFWIMAFNLVWDIYCTVSGSVAEKAAAGVAESMLIYSAKRYFGFGGMPATGLPTFQPPVRSIWRDALLSAVTSRFDKLAGLALCSLNVLQM
jgi:hypothetical protein